MNNAAPKQTPKQVSPVSARDGRTTTRQKRFGAVIGGRIMLLVRRNGAASAGAIARKLNLEESYVRRICRAFVEDGLLTMEQVEQRGTRAVKLYTSVP